MSSITLVLPADGAIVEAPLGQPTRVVASGRLDVAEIDPTAVSVSVQAGSQLAAAAIDLQGGTFSASFALAGPASFDLQATLAVTTERDVGAGKPPIVRVATYRSNKATIALRDSAVDPFLLRARCVDGAGRPLAGLTVEAWDRDPRSPDDKLGATATSGADGQVQFYFRRADFSEAPGERQPDVYFTVADRGARVGCIPRDLANDQGMLRNFTPGPDPVVLRVFLMGEDIRQRWLSAALQPAIGLTTSDEQATPDGIGRFSRFERGVIYWAPRCGAFEVLGPILGKWAELGSESGSLGYPVTGELAQPGTDGGRYNVFEHGIVTWQPGQAAAQAGPHHYERIHAAARAQILSRFFAMGASGRRNHLSMLRQLAGAVPEDPAASDLARWSVTSDNNDNPWMLGAQLLVAMAIEQAAGNEESRRVLASSQDTLSSLMAWNEPGVGSAAGLPLRWDAGIPNDGPDESTHFLCGADGRYLDSLPSSDMHHYARRATTTLQSLIGPSDAQAYIDAQGDYSQRYRGPELSTDELCGLVASCWSLAKLTTDPAIQAQATIHAHAVGNYVADNGYVLVRPMGAVSYRGGVASMLPVYEYPIARALGSVTGSDFSARIDFKTAMTRAGYWRNLGGTIEKYQVLGWTFAVAAGVVAPALVAGLGLVTAGVEGFLADQVVPLGSVLAGCAVLDRHDCFDVEGRDDGGNEQIEAAGALIARAAPNKPALYRAVTTLQAQFVPFTVWSVDFQPWMGLTGLDDPDPVVRDTYLEWFRLRQALADPGREPKGHGSRTLFAAGIAALLANDDASEQHLVAELERGIVDLYRDCYFDPRIPVTVLKDSDGNPNGWREDCVFPWRETNDRYAALDLLVGMSLAFLHAQRAAAAGMPVATPRFPQPLAAARFASWPIAAVPANCLPALAANGIGLEAIQGTPDPVAGASGYALFPDVVVPRRRAPRRAPDVPVGTLMCDVTLQVRAQDTGDIATGVTLFKGHEIQIDANGRLWAGAVGVDANGPAGSPGRMADDTTWPLHTGIDPAATQYCLLGRLNGYFRIGDGIGRTRWRYHEARPLFLRVNDDVPGDGNGQFSVRIRVWADAGGDPAQVYSPPDVLRTGGRLLTTEAADMIEVRLEPNALADGSVEFVLATAPGVTWRKEIIVREGPTAGDGSWTIYAQDARHGDATGLYGYQLPGGSLEFRKMKGGGGMFTTARLDVLAGLQPGTRVTFDWVHD